jgi:alpha,alpha-trehalose-phosphate synthase [UDP-forming]
VPVDEISRTPQTTASVLADERLLPRRFLVVSNRLPYRLSVLDERVVFERGAGGLVTAMDPIIRLTGGTWIGWSATYDTLPDKIRLGSNQGTSRDYFLKPVSLSPAEVERYYLGYSNKTLWPLFHYFQEHCEINPAQWQTYKDVNRRFADAIIDEYEEGDLIWIHDYHLMLVPSMVRRAIPEAKIGFFLHIPFPSVEIFLIEPHAEELLDGLMGADLIGFHSESYAYNFIDAVVNLTGFRYERAQMRVNLDGRTLTLRAIPISVDFAQFERVASGVEIPAKVEEIRNNYRAEFIALGVDRLDYTKGILERLHAIEIMLDRHQDIQGKFTFVQISAPSRTKVEAYRDMRGKIEQMVGRINGRFGGKGCIPIDYRYEGYPQSDLAAYYRAADVALVTPLRDGMNLVAKEYVACRVDEGGALVLSRFAGAYKELSDAIIVNPYDAEAMADRFYEAIMMPDDEKRRRMRRMRGVVRRNDIYWWLERFLRNLA